MDTLKTMGKRMKPIFVFMLLEVLLAVVLIGCQTQGLDPKKWKHAILAFIAVLVFALLYDLRWVDNWNSVRNLLSTIGTVSTLILLLIRFIRKRKLSVVTGSILLMASEGIAALLLTFL